ncbi:MAG: sulfotransferase [Gammaproteobacteria bacterium]
MKSKNNDQPGLTAATAQPAKPVFILGSYRSGTSIFCWCLGQHPNMVNLPETNWLAQLTVDLHRLYRLGTLNHRFSHLGQIDISLDRFYDLFGQGVEHIIQAINPLLIEKTERKPKGNLRRRRSPHDPKHRWVDATPENSHYVYALSKLFPEARFIHLLRNPDEVARSLMKFSAAGARDHAHDEAYHNWLRLVSVCYDAEQALGTKRMIRVQYDELVGNPEETFQRVSSFLDEPYSADCCLPLQEKINSSRVSPESVPLHATRAAREAHELYQRILQGPQIASDGDPVKYTEIEAVFLQYCQDMHAPPLRRVQRGVMQRIARLWKKTG